jgi:ubiquinone/menaquinone biosynthesis C-methylase UbiE
MEGSVRSGAPAVGPVTRHPRAGREIGALGGARRFRGRDVLDVGTGDGRLAFDLALHARRVVGVDLSGEYIELARRRGRELALENLIFRVGDASRLDLGRELFDIAIFSWSL